MNYSYSSAVLLFVHYEYGAMNIVWIIPHFLSMIGFLLALILLLHLLKDQRSPSSTIAWVLAIILVPYAGVPLYIIFGGRKMKKMTGTKEIRPERRDFPDGENRIPNAFKVDGTLFPSRKGNYVQLLLTGENAFKHLMQSIAAAQTSIYITTFILGNDATGKAIVESLAGKAREGLDVFLLLDALGSGSISEDFLSDFRAAGGHYAFFMPMLHIPFRGRANLRNHRKMVLIDRRLAIIGGMNLAGEYMGDIPDSSRWHDLSLAVQGPVVDDLLTVFQSDWKFAAKENVPFRGEKNSSGDRDNTTTLQLVPSGPDVAGDPLYDTVLTALFTAQQRIWIVTPYFIPDEMLVKALCIAAHRTVDVRIVVPRTSNHRLADLVRRTYLRQIQEAGAQVYQFAPCMLHGKVILIDESPAIVGSMNMDMRSFFLNYEIALFIHSKSIVAQLESWIGGLMNESDTGMKSASVFVDYTEGLVRMLAPLL